MVISRLISGKAVDMSLVSFFLAGVVLGVHQLVFGEKVLSYVFRFIIAITILVANLHFVRTLEGVIGRVDFTYGMIASVVIFANIILACIETREKMGEMSTYLNL